MDSKMSPLLSVVVPMFNEQDVFPVMVKRLRPILDGLGNNYEVVAVDDGSSDDTYKLLSVMRRAWPELRVIRLRRNCGHQAALTAGLHRSHGQYVVSIDADLQDPPEKILEMLDLAQRESLDVVYGVRSDRTSDTFMKRNTAALYYRIMGRLTGGKMLRHGGDFRLLSRASVDLLKSLPEQQPVYRLLVPWMGLPSGEVYYVREKRAAGHTKYPFGKMLRLALDSMTNFSAAPLRLATWLGLVSIVICFLIMIAGAVVYALGHVVPGWTSLLVAIVFLGSVQLLCLGLLGEYVGRIYSAVQGRPAYFIAKDTAEPGEDEDGWAGAESETTVPSSRYALVQR